MSYITWNTPAPFAKKSLVVQDTGKDYTDYICRTNNDEHIYLYRYRNDTITQLKVRFTEADGNKLYFKVYYDQDRSEIWTKTNDRERISIAKSFQPDFTDLAKLKTKIRTYMLFS